MFQVVHALVHRIGFPILSMGLLLSGSISLAADPVHIVNRWKPDHALHTERGPITAGVIQPGWHSAQWLVEVVAGEPYVRLRNRHTGLYLHAQQQRLEVGEILPGWWSAMWTIESVPESDFWRLRNRWLESHVHIEHGRAELGEVLPGWWSAMWQVRPLSEVRPTQRPQAERAPPTAPNFSGQSMADGQLRQDIHFQVAVAFESSHGCPIESIEASVVQVNRNSAGTITGLEETWLSRGCGRRSAFRVLTSPSSRGGIDISVTERQ